MLALLRTFLADPFDPANNVALFSAFDQLLPPPSSTGPAWHPPADPDDAWRVFCLVRKRVESDGDTGWLWPEEHAFKAAWPSLTPRARVLAFWHDFLHTAMDIEQDVAGEYELAVRLLIGPSDAMPRGAELTWFVGLHRIYGALSLCTLPVGMYHAGLAPLRGVWAGLRGGAP